MIPDPYNPKISAHEQRRYLRAQVTATIYAAFLTSYEGPTTEHNRKLLIKMAEEDAARILGDGDEP